MEQEEVVCIAAVAAEMADVAAAVAAEVHRTVAVEVPRIVVAAVEEHRTVAAEVPRIAAAAAVEEPSNDMKRRRRDKSLCYPSTNSISYNMHKNKA
jgi:hypothetical protein